MIIWCISGGKYSEMWFGVGFFRGGVIVILVLLNNASV